MAAGSAGLVRFCVCFLWKMAQKHGEIENAGYGLEFLFYGLEFLTLVIWTEGTPKSRD